MFPTVPGFAGETDVPKQKRRTTHPLGLSSLDINALSSLEKRGELILDFEGKYFVNSTGFGCVHRVRMEKLANFGLCRIDMIGESTFAVFVRMP